MHDIDRTQQEWGGSYEYGPSSGYITAGETPLDEILGKASTKENTRPNTMRPRMN